MANTFEGDAGLLPRPKRIRRTGDDSPAGSLARFLWRMSGWHQLALVLVAAATAGLALAPIELQRRLVDDAISAGDGALLLWLGGLYAAAILAQRVGKFALELYQGWLSESAILYCRDHLAGLYCRKLSAGEGRDPGQAVSVIGPEIGKLGGFVGEGPSRLAFNATMLIGVGGYMLTVEPRIAAVALGFLLPQALLTPLIQRKINRLSERGVGQMRGLGQAVAEERACRNSPTRRRLRLLYALRMRIFLWKAVLKGALNLLSAAGPLLVLLVGGWLAIEGETSVGVLLAFVSGIDRMSGPARELIGFYRQAALASVQHRKISEWM